MEKKKEYALKKYFFWNDKPYKVISENRRKNIMEALDIIDNKRIMLPWTDWMRHREKAYTTAQVARMLGRHHIRVRLWISEGKIPKPFTLDSVDTQGERGFGKQNVNMLWREKDIYIAQEYMESTGRKKDVPTRAELQAMMNSDKLIQFIQGEDGEFIPLWRA